MFYYQEIGVEVNGGLTRQNMPLILCIQTPWQREMMIEYGHQGGVVIDVTFGTNEKKVIHYTCMWYNTLIYNAIETLIEQIKGHK
jgi:hypothetical protein